MAFSFGAPAAAPGGTTNGGNSSASASTTPGSAPAAGFSFGGTQSATTAPAAFGATTTPPAGNNNAIPSTGGFSFGANAPAALATEAPASTSGFSFGGNASSSTTRTAAPSPATGFTFAHAPSSAITPAASAPATSTSTSNTAGVNDPVVTVPEFVTVFPNMFVLGKVDDLLPQASLDTNDGRLAAQELHHLLGCDASQDITKVFGAYLAKPQPFEWKQQDAALRQKLKTNPHVSLHGQTAALTLGMLEEVFKLSDELHISEVDALTLYAEASRRQTRQHLQDRLDYSFVDNALSGSIEPLVLGDDVFRASRELFFYEKSCAIKATIKLIQHRLELNTAVLCATDQLLVANLVDNLIAFIKEWTRRTNLLEQELSNASRPAQNMFGLQPPPAENREANFTKVHLKFGYDQRLMAAESIFYLTYHTQCTSDEVGSIIDLIKDLSNGTTETNGIKLLDPFHDVPNAYYDPPTIANNQFPFSQPLPPLREKDTVTWQRELVDQVWKSGGKPQLLQSVSTLVLSVVCALNTRTELVDRHTHAINSFGTGNALFPPQNNDTQQLLSIHSRLNPMGTESRDWKRVDIWGILVASYALLLRSLPSVASSPRVGSTTPTSSPRPTGPVDVKTTWRACMNVPTGTKAFSCIRLCLMPSFERHKDKLEAKCDTFEFFMSVSSDFIAHFLDVLCASGDVPISRSQWERDAERDLELRREQQQQTNQFRAWTGTRSTSVDNESIPTSVDLVVRPDCLDDVIALAIALCSVGPSYATFFWSKSHEEIDEIMSQVLVPSRALRKLQHQLETDKSLLPVYVSFLAALALAPAVADGTESGASIVNRLLQSDGDTSQVNWLSLMNAIRWYAGELSPGSETVTKSTSESSSSSPGLPGRPSTAYYYGAEDSGAEGSTGYSSQHASSSSSPTSSKAKEMGETNTNILLSHLEVIATVASESSAARSVLVSTVLPVAGQEGDDPFLTVLFLLSIAPLTPLLRGAVFSTIASLLKVDGANQEERKIIEEQSMKGWKLLDTCNVLPISLLDQYESLPERAAQVTEGLAFPPSSISLVSKETKGDWLPPERIYGIIFEMEQIESRSGQYPSTEGFLQLLTSLFVAAGSPGDLGQGVRSRPGCTPYLEYVTNFVLARALDTKKDGVSLPFRAPSDKYRLVSRGLEVIEAVLVRYTVPPPASTSPVPLLVDEKRNQQSATSQVSHVFGLSTLIEKIVIAPNERDAQEARFDYRDSSVVRVAPGRTQDSISSTIAPEKSATDLQFPGGAPPVPRAKSPGFTVLVELLSSSVGPLLNALVTVLTDDHVARGIRHVCGLEEYKTRISEALFGQTPPTVGSARAKSSDTSHISPQALLQPLLPQLEAIALNRDDAVCWRETSIILALRLLCAAAAREESFSKSVSAGRTLLKIIPVLRFNRRSLLPASGIVVRNVQVSRIADLLFSFGRSAIHSNAYIEPFPAVIQYVQCDASTIAHDGDIASPAVALIYYASHSLGTNEGIRALVGSRGGGISRFATVMGKRLSRSAMLSASHVDSDIASLILDSILSTFRRRCAREASISHVILGLPFTVSGGNWAPGTYENAFQHAASMGVTRDCFDAILGCLSSLEFLTDSHSSYLATKCFEIMYRLTEATGDDSASERRIRYAANMLRSNHFWTMNLMLFLADHTSGTESLLRLASSITPEYRPKGIENCLHCIAWLLKSVSSEILALDHPYDGSTSGQRCQLLSLLFSSPYRLLMNVLVSMPISDDRNDYLGQEGMPSREALEMSRVAMSGAPEVVEGYTCINKSKLAQLCSSSSSLKEQMLWADGWNAWISWDCAASHLSVAILYLVESAMISIHPSAGVGTGGGSSLGAFELHSPVDMMKEILSRLVAEGSPKMDGRLSPNVSDTLSRIVLLLSKQLAPYKAAADVPNISTESSHIEICRLLVQAVVSSSFVDQGRPLQHHEKLRTATFGLALSIAMKSNAEVNADELDGEFLEASISLGRIATSASSTSRFEATGVTDRARATHIAQVAFASVLDLYRTEENLSIVPLLSAPADPGVGRTVIQSIASLIANQDEHVYHVAEKVVICSEGPEILLNARLPQAIRQAARDYVAQEQKVMEELRYSSATLDIPAFLRGHMLLIKSLLLSPALPSNRRKQLDVDILDVLLTYTGVFHRIFNSFHQNTEVLAICLQCLSLCCNESASLQDFVSDERGATWNQDILQLTYVLSQNPLPREYLPTLPMKINDLGQSVPVAGNVFVSDSNKKDSSWWDAIEQSSQTGNGTNVLLAGPPSGQAQVFGWRSHPSSLDAADGDRWTASTYEMALMGAEMLESCLSYLESLSMVQPFRSLDVRALSRGLCRCSDVAKGAHYRFEALQCDVSETYDSTDAMEITYSDPVRRREEQKLEMYYIGKLKGLMQRCSEKLFLVISAHVQALRHAYENEYERLRKSGFLFTLKESCDSVSVALDYTKIDFIGMESGSDDANKIRKLLRDFCKVG